MPKKGRHARHARTQASENSSGRSSPAPALLDMRAGTPDVAQRVLEQATPFFSLGNDTDPVESAVSSVYEEEEMFPRVVPPPPEEEEEMRPSPLELSPLPPAQLGELIDVGTGYEGQLASLGHTRSPVMETYVRRPLPDRLSPIINPERVLHAPLSHPHITIPLPFDPQWAPSFLSSVFFIYLVLIRIPASPPSSAHCPRPSAATRRLSLKRFLRLPVSRVLSL
jgi:hypothetical protein